MPRVRALVLLGLFLVNQAACTSWQVPKVTPQEYAAQHPDKKWRFTAKDDQGGWSTAAGVVLTEVRFSGDSVFGRNPNGQPVAYSLSQVGVIEVRRVSAVRTTLLVAWAFFVAWGIGTLGAAVIACDPAGCPPL